MGANFDEAAAAFQRGDLDRARMLAEVALADSPSAQWRHLLGLVECRLGNPAAGAERFRAAVEAEPANAGYRVMLVRALVDSGRANEALDVPAPREIRTPADLALWQARAEAADSAGARAQSVEAWNQVCNFSSEWQAWSNYGYALAAAERWPEAARAFARALELNPGELPLRRSLAAALARAGRHEESADELRRWVDAAPEDVENRLLLARLLVDLGHDEESAAQLEKAAQLKMGAAAGDIEMIGIVTNAGGTADLRLLGELTRLLERTNRLDELRRLLDDAEALGVAREQLGFPAAAVALRDGDALEAKRLLDHEAPDVDPARWHWLMARIADSLGDAELAFREAEAMNRSVAGYQSWLQRADRHIAWARALGATITPEWAARLRPLASGERRGPAFVVGFPRSGTTLFDTFLMGHPGTKVLEEIPVINAVEGVLGKVATLPDRSQAELERARTAYFAELDRHVENRDVLAVDKLPLNMLAAAFIHCIFPDAPIVFVQRHPCDAVLSCFMQGFALNNSMACLLDMERAADYYDAAMTVWTRSRECLPLNSRTIIYEELVADPEAAIRPIIDFLGLDWSEALLDHRATAKARGAINTPSYNQVTQPLTGAPSGRWRRYEKQLASVLPVLLPWAERLGYAD